MTLSIRNLLINLANIFLGIVSLLLGLRIIFRLFQANPATPFVNWIYSASDYLISPFRGIFSTQNVNGSPVDISAIIAWIIYAILVYVFIALVKALTSSGTNRYERQEHVHN